MGGSLRGQDQVPQSPGHTQQHGQSETVDEHRPQRVGADQHNKNKLVSSSYSLNQIYYQFSLEIFWFFFLKFFLDLVYWCYLFCCPSVLHVAQNNIMML